LSISENSKYIASINLGKSHAEQDKNIEILEAIEVFSIQSEGKRIIC
jgi:hypothetical protein